MECKVIVPSSTLPWWTISKMSEWEPESLQNGESSHSIESRTVKQWQTVMSKTLSLQSANWEISPPIPITHAAQIAPLPLKIFGRITTVDFIKNEIKLVLHQNTITALILAYDIFLTSKIDPLDDIEETNQRKIFFKKQLDGLKVSLGCAALICSTGKTGGGSFIDYKHDHALNHLLPEPKLDLVLGLRAFKDKGLADMIASFFPLPLPSTSVPLLPKIKSEFPPVVTRSKTFGKKPDPIDINIDDYDDLDIALMSPDRRAWVQYRFNARVPKQKKTSVKKAKSSRNNLIDTMNTEQNDTTKHKHRPIIRVDTQTATTSNILNQVDENVIPRRRAANIYEDSRGGKRRRPSCDLKFDDDVIHTLVADIEAGIKKQRLSPDYASSDSGLGLLSPPGGSRTSKSPDLENNTCFDPGMINPSDLSYYFNSEFETDWSKMNQFDINSKPSYYDSSSDEEDMFPPPLTIKKFMTSKQSQPQAKLKRQPLTQQQTITSARTSNGKLTRFEIPPISTMNSIKKHRFAKSAYEHVHLDADYTDFSDLERDSDTPIYELLVDSEDETEHRRRKLARRKRKFEKRQRMVQKV